MRRIAVITGTRAEWGILKSVCAAIQARADLSLTVFAGGAHLLPPANTIDEVRAFASDAILFEMQRKGEAGRLADAAALGRGIQHLSALLHVMSWKSGKRPKRWQVSLLFLKPKSWCAVSVKCVHSG